MSGAALQNFTADRRCDRCPVRHHAICSALEEDRSHILSEFMGHKHFEREQMIWVEEDDADFFAIVVSGAVKLFKVLEDGREQIIGLLLESDCLGSLYSVRQPSYAEAVTDTELCCFPRTAFERIVGKHPELEHALLEKAMSDLDDAREWMVALGRKTAGEKVASFLLYLARRSQYPKCADRPTPDSLTFTLPLSRQEIADYLGLTIETVSRHLTKLKAAGVIRLIDARTIEVLDPDALEYRAAS